MEISNASLSEDVAESDYFAFVYDRRDKSAQVLLGISWCLVHCVGNPLLLGLISYRQYGSLNYQTLIDKLKVFMSFVMMLYSITGFNIICLRAFGPLPSAICAFQVLEMAFLSVSTCLALVQSYILRFLYSCVWKNVGVLNDELVAQLLISFNILFAFGYCSLFAITEDFSPFDMAVCSGSNPNILMDHPKLFSSRPRLTTIFIMTCIFICFIFRVIIHKRTKEQSLDMKADLTKMFGWSKFMECSLAFAVLVSLIPGSYSRFMCHKGLIKQVPPFIITFSLVSPSLLFYMVLLSSVYMRNKLLRQHVLRFLRDLQIVQALKERCPKFPF